MNKNIDIQNPSMISSDIGARLLEAKVISEDQLDIALKEQARTQNKKTIGAILVDMGVITEGALGEILNESSGLRKFDIRASIIDPRLSSFTTLNRKS